MRETRKHYVNVRFSDKEFEKLNTLMHLSGYNNRSKFIRYSILQRRDRRRYLSRNDANVSKQIELLRLDLKRIGVNYNQRVKALNRLANLKVMDQTAFTMCRENNIPIEVFDMTDPVNLNRLLAGENVGTVVSNE